MFDSITVRSTGRFTNSPFADKGMELMDFARQIEFKKAKKERDKKAAAARRRAQVAKQIAARNKGQEAALASSPDRAGALLAFKRLKA